VAGPRGAAGLQAELAHAEAEAARADLASLAVPGPGRSAVVIAPLLAEDPRRATT